MISTVYYHFIFYYCLFLLTIFSAISCNNIVDVFIAGESGYYCIKIPYIITTNKGTIIAFAEGRIGSCSDFTSTDLVYKRSYDNGNTWSDLYILYSNYTSDNAVVIGNAAPVQVRETNRILVPFCRNNYDVLITYSDDDGVTWENPIIISEQVTLSEWKWIGLGPPAGIQLDNGRIIIPSYHTTTLKGDGELSKGHIMYSDDLGESWQLGCTEFGDYYLSNECQAVDLGNNKILINARSAGTYRLQTISYDGGLTFDSTYKVRELRESLEGCEGSIINYHSNSLLFFSNPSNSGIYRMNMTIHVSSDLGDSWELYKVIDEGPTAYSALTILSNNSVALLYERSSIKQLIFVPEKISFIVFYP